MIAGVRFHQQRVAGTVLLPASKSISNRYLLLRSLAGSDAEIANLSEARDTRLLQELLNSTTTVLDAQDAGTVYRFLTAMLAYKPGKWQLTGTPRMQERPVGALVEALRTLGADIRYTGKDGYPPLEIQGGKLVSGSITVDGSVSSQFISALLLVAPFLPQGLRVRTNGELVSAPYIAMTVAILRKCGIPVDVNGQDIHISAAPVRLENAVVESDWSSAAFFFEAACLSPEASIHFPGLEETSVQGDARLATLGSHFGLISGFDESGWRLEGTGRHPNSVELDLRGEPDLFPALCAAAAGMGMTGSFSGLGHLRNKESDRLLAMEENLLLLGADCSLVDDGLVLHSAQPLRTDGILLNGFADHRIVMAMALLATRCGYIRVTDAEQVAKSFPGFWKALGTLGYEVQLEP